MLNRMEPDGRAFVQRPNCQTLNPRYAQSIITHGRGSTMEWIAFAWHDVGSIVKINEKMFRYQYLNKKNKMESWAFKYIHNWSSEPFIQVYWPSFSHHLCVLILYISGETYILKSTPNYRFFKNLFMAVLIYSQSFCQKSADSCLLNTCHLFYSYLCKIEASNTHQSWQRIAFIKSTLPF